MLQKISINQVHIFKELYFAYSTELSQYSQRLRDDPINDEDIEDILDDPLLERYFITNENKKPIGFCLLGFGENTQPGTNWYIQEFYIHPEYRKQNYGTNAIQKLLTTHPGIYCYFVLKENKKAQSFWTNIKSKFNCIDVTSNYDASPYTPKDCVFYAFRTA